MLPPTHFLAGLFFGLIGFKLQILTLLQVLLAAVLAVAMDFDHVVTYLIRYKKFTVKGWNKSIAGNESLWTPIHFWPAFFIINIFLMTLALVYQPATAFSFVILVAYTPHFLLDRIYKQSIKNKKPRKVRFLGFVFNFFLFELWFDLVFILFLITVLLS